METLWIIFILLIATRFCGVIAIKLGQPILIGEISAGVAVGLIIGWLGMDIKIFDIGESHHFMVLSDLGIFFLMLLGGLEMRPRELVESSFMSVTIAISAMLVPLTGGFVLTWFWLPESELRFARSLFVGTALAITAVPVVIKVLMDLDMLKARIGKLIVSAAVVDDLLSLVLLSILTAILNTGVPPTGSELLFTLLQILVFLAAVWVLGSFAMPPVARYLDHLDVEEMDFSFLLITGVVFALLAEFLGLHYILGAFAAGLFFGRHTINTRVYEDLRTKVIAITNGFLAPIFFASIGFELDLSAVIEVPVFLGLLIVIAFAGKLAGSFFPAIAWGMSSRDALTIGTAMSVRGAVELIIAGIALRAGLFDGNGADLPVVDNMFSAVVIVAIVTTLLAPVALRIILAKR